MNKTAAITSVNRYLDEEAEVDVELVDVLELLLGERKVKHLRVLRDARLGLALGNRHHAALNACEREQGQNKCING